MSTRKYWLFKSEPDTFSFSDLEAAPHQTTGWEGVRNYQARNYLRDEVKVGDGVLFYHSRVEPIGIVGMAEVVREGYPDSSALDPDSHYYDPKSSAANPIWIQVDIRFGRAFSQVVTLEQLKSTAGLEHMKVVQKGQRLSVQPVTEGEWLKVLALGGVAEGG